MAKKAKMEAGEQAGAGAGGMGGSSRGWGGLKNIKIWCEVVGGGAGSKRTAINDFKKAKIRAG
jgi:hypothetical protein